MNTKEKIEFNNLWIRARTEAIANITECLHPQCSDNSINSHILQRNGILTPLIDDGFIMQMEINPYEDPPNFFKRKSAKQAFAFNCFCSVHDDQIFKPIEVHPIDFELYENRLLFLVRSKYNEKFRKLVVLDILDKVISHFKDNGNLTAVQYYEQKRAFTQLGLGDIKNYEDLIWKDLNKGSESLIIERREIDFLPICMASFFDYETTNETNAYRLANGKEMEELSSIFITAFPYDNRSQMILAYKKSDEVTLKHYVNTFLKESQKRIERKLTNLMLFQCETWVMSEEFYKTRIKCCDGFFDYAAQFSNSNLNERINVNLNMFRDGFCEGAMNWKKRMANKS